MPQLYFWVYEGDLLVSQALARPVRQTPTGFAGVDYRGCVFEVYGHRYGRPAIDLKCPSWSTDDRTCPIASELPPYRDEQESGGAVDQAQPSAESIAVVGPSHGEVRLKSILVQTLLRMNLSVRAKSVLKELARYPRWQRMTLADYLEDPPPLEAVGDVRTSAEVRRAIKRLYKLEIASRDQTNLADDPPGHVRSQIAMPDEFLSASAVDPKPVVEVSRNEVPTGQLVICGEGGEFAPKYFAPHRLLRVLNEGPTHIDSRRGRWGTQLIASQTSVNDELETDAEPTKDHESPIVTAIRVASVNLFDFGCHLRALYDGPAAKQIRLYEWIDRICGVAADVHFAAIEDPGELLGVVYKSGRYSAALEELAYLVDAGAFGDEPFRSFGGYPDAVACEIGLLDGLTSYWTRQLVSRAVELRSLLEGSADPRDHKDMDL